MKKNLSLNIIKEEHSENDYLLCWSELGSRPNKLNLFDLYDIDQFIEFINSNSKESFGTFTDIIPNGDDHLINERNLIKISDHLFISFIFMNKLSEEAAVGEVTIIYSNEGTEEASKLLDEISSMAINLDEESSNYRIKSLSLGQSGLEVDTVDLMNYDKENFESYFNDETIKEANKLIKSIKKNNKGLHIVHGERGCGKTNLVNWIVSQIDKSVIFIPCSLIDATVTPDFRSFIKRYKNSVIIFDDLDVYFNDLNSKMNLLTNNLLQLVDGYLSDDLGLNIICIFNEKSESDLDETLLSCNNLLHIIEVDRLEEKKCEDLSKILGNKSKFKTATKLVDVIKDRKQKNTSQKMGY